MRVLFITQGALGHDDRERVTEVVARYARDPDVSELYFGFTEETTPGAAFALSVAAQARLQHGPSITTVVPHRLDALPAETRHAAEMGEQLLELKFGEEPRGHGFPRYAYNRYSSYVIELVRDIGQAVVFWDGTFTREPWDTVRWLRLVNGSGAPMRIEASGLVLDYLPFELYDLRGPEQVVHEAHETEHRRRKK